MLAAPVTRFSKSYSVACSCLSTLTTEQSFAFTSERRPYSVPELGGVRVGGAAHHGQQARQRAQRLRQAARAQRVQRARAA